MAFTNLEVLLHDYEPYPAYQSGGTWMRADPKMAEELVWAGFDMVSYANNHTGDYGPLGARLTRQHARAAGLVGAGSGEDLNEAREAKFLETADGRVALISLASTFTEHSVAGLPGAATVGRPGLNPLRHERWRVVTREQLEALREGLTAAGIRVRGGLTGSRSSATGSWWETSPAHAPHPTRTTSPPSRPSCVTPRPWPTTLSCRSTRTKAEPTARFRLTS